MIKLNPCAKCGALPRRGWWKQEAGRYYNGNEHFYYCACPKCQGVKIGYVTSEAAAVRWNATNPVNPKEDNARGV